METTKEITGKFTPEFKETVKQFGEWLFEQGYNYNLKDWTFIIKFKSDQDFEKVAVKAWELDRDNNPQMDLFEQGQASDSEDQSVLDEPQKQLAETIEGDFEEIEPKMWIIKAQRELEEDAVFTMQQVSEPTETEISTEFERLGYEDELVYVSFYVKEADGKGDSFHRPSTEADNSEVE